jgi:hypothetical protein
MTQHVSTSRINHFCVQALPVEELTTIAGHLSNCSTCHDQFTKTLQSRRGSSPLKFALAPEFWFRNEHVDYEQLVGLADNSLQPTERTIIDIHLKVCASCKEDVRSFLEFREQMTQETETTYAPVTQEPAREKFSWLTWWRGLAWKPIYAAAVVVIGIAIVIGAAFLLKRRAENLQARQVPVPQVSPGSTPDGHAANLPSPPASPNESPIEKPNTAEEIVALNDRGRTITVDKSGNVAGLDDVPVPTREEIAKVLLSERLEQPAIVRKLSGQEGTLRGRKSAQPFKLTYPSRKVIVTDRPTLKWEKASGASSYRVYVNNPAGREVARSEELPSERTEWILPKPLKRGEIYVWTVVAVVNGKEIVSPGVSSPEMKFQVLPLSSLRELDHLKKTRSRLALGVFYTRLGLIDAAEREFQELVRLNPHDTVTKKLLRSVTLIRGTLR